MAGLSRRPRSEHAFERLPDVMFFKRVTLFQGLSADYLYELTLLARPLQLAAGSLIFERGDEGDALYLVCEGHVNVRIEQRQVARLSAGEPLGELALLDGETRSAAAVADTDTRLLRLTVDDFQALLHSEPSLRRSLLRTLYRRLGGLRSSHLPSGAARMLSISRRRALGIGELVIALSILRDAELFRGLSPEGLLRMATCAHPVSHFEGEVVYEAGTAADAFYIVCSGEVALTTGSAQLARLERGDCFGEGAVIAHDVREHGARVLQDAQLLRVRASELDQLLDAEPDVGVAMLRHFAARLRAEIAQRVAQ